MPNFTEDNDTFGMALDAIRSAKKREFERVDCPGFNKTVDKKFCEEKKRENSLRCQMCADMMVVRKKFIKNLIKFKSRTERYADIDSVRITSLTKTSDGIKK